MYTVYITENEIARFSIQINHKEHVSVAENYFKLVVCFRNRKVEIQICILLECKKHERLNYTFIVPLVYNDAASPQHVFEFLSVASFTLFFHLGHVAFSVQPRAPVWLH